MQNKTLAEISYRASLILERLIESLADELKALHARNAAKGSLKSGATIKESSRIARSVIQSYFAELEKFVLECPSGSSGSDSVIVNAVSSITTSLITSINDQLTATAALAGDADLVRHIQSEISEELSASQELFRSNLRARWLKPSSQKISSRIERAIFAFEIVCFFLTVIFVILWIQKPSGDYDSLAALFGLGSFASQLIRQFFGPKKS